MKPEDIPAEAVQPDTTINEPEVHSTPEIPEVIPGAIVKQENDPVFIELQREKKRNRRLKRLLTLNKNRSTVGTDSTTSPGSEPGSEPPTLEGEAAAPVLSTTPAGAKKRDPISAAINFLGKGKKKRDGP